VSRVGKILVIGGGVGGLATAIAARRAGIAVDLVELRRDWKVYHVGIMVQGNFLRALEQLGIVDEIVAAGFPQGGVAFEDLHGHALFDVPGVQLASPRWPSDLGITRPALHEVLTRHARALGTDVRLGVTFQDIDATRLRPRVRFSDGSSGEYDYVVAADGVHSAARGALFGAGHEPRYSGQGVWRYNLPRPRQVSRLTMLMGLRHGKCGFCPVSDATGYVLLVQAEPGNPRHPPERLASIMRERLAPCGGWMGELREQITDSALVVYRPLEVILMPAPWYKGSVLLIGDAAHATTPHLGQGAAQAVEDAIVVVGLLAKGLTGETVGQAFMQRRYERLKFIWEASVQIGEWEQRDDPGQDPGGLTRRMLEVVVQPI
jgi:2-polyprenyl-6-methoxyphenol hydroxylase-like FAD-dependent oxidoreductase